MGVSLRSRPRLGLVVACTLLATLVGWTGRGSAAPSHPPAQAEADFNGDGFADLAIGVYLEDVGPLPDAGAVIVLYGSPLGLQATSPDDQLWTQNSPGVPGVAAAGDGFGWGLGTGDFDDDGFADLSVGAPTDDEPVLDGGSRTILYGSAAGLSAVGSQLWTQDSPSVKDVAEEGDAFGRIAGVGDFNGDGFADCAISVHGEDVGAIVDAGAVNVLYGSPSGLQATSPDDQFWTQDTPSVKDVAETGDGFGRGWLAAADFNLDGFADLAVGHWLEDVGALEDAGAANVLYGSALGLQATSPDDQFWTQDTPEVQDVAGDFDFFGWSLAAADFNGNGFADLAIGAMCDSSGGVGCAGGVNVLYGSAAGLQATSPDDQFWNQNKPGVPDQMEDHDAFGISLVGLDFNADGFDDVAVGAGQEDLGTIVDAGIVQVLYGSVSGLQTSSPPIQSWSQNSPGVLDGSEPDDFFGLFLGGGDYNGDGKLDLSIYAVEEDVGAVLNAGAASVLYGSVSGLQATSPADQFWNQNSPGVLDMAEADDCLGCYGWIPDP